MAYLLLPMLLTVLLAGYLTYLYFVKKDPVRFHAVLYPGLLFITIWVIMYWFIFK